MGGVVGVAGALADTVAHKTLLHLTESQLPSCEETSCNVCLSSCLDHLDGHVKNNSNNDAYKLQRFDAFGLCNGEEISAGA